MLLRTIRMNEWTHGVRDFASANFIAFLVLNTKTNHPELTKDVLWLYRNTRSDEFCAILDNGQSLMKSSFLIDCIVNVVPFAERNDFSSSGNKEILS